MPEGEPIRIPIRIAEDELAPESIPHIPLPAEALGGLTPKQFDRLNVFKNMVKTIFEARKDEVETGVPHHFGRIVNGQVAQTHFTMDAAYRATWSERAFNLYESEMLPDPDLKEVADDIVDELRHEYDNPAAMSPEELEALYER